MIVLVIVLAVVAIIAIVLALVTRSRLTGQRAAAATATAAAEQAAAERTAEATRASSAEAARDEAAARATTAEEQASASAAAAAAAEARAAEAATQAATQVAAAEALAADAEARAAEAAARNGLDPELLWTLERARSERTWRQSVALGPGGSSVFDGTDNPLREALQVELDAAREDVGALAELDTDVPADVTAAGSVLVLRAAQELLARAVKVAEETTLRVLVDGADVVVTVVATDEDGTAVALPPLVVPPSADLEATDGGVRVKRAIPVGSSG